MSTPPSRARRRADRYRPESSELWVTADKSSRAVCLADINRTGYGTRMPETSGHPLVAALRALSCSPWPVRMFAAAPSQAPGLDEHAAGNLDPILTSWTFSPPVNSPPRHRLP